MPTRSGQLRPDLDHRARKEADGFWVASASCGELCEVCCEVGLRPFLKGPEGSPLWLETRRSPGALSFTNPSRSSRCAIQGILARPESRIQRNCFWWRRFLILLARRDAAEGIHSVACFTSCNLTNLQALPNPHLPRGIRSTSSIGRYNSDGGGADQIETPCFETATDRSGEPGSEIDP